MRCALVLPVWAEILLNEMPRSGETSSAAQGSERGSDLRTCMVLLAHGSREPRWREPFERIYLQMRRDLGDDVRIAYMEFTGPTLFDVAEECSKVDVRKLRILPLFMAAGAHLVTDVPEQAQQLRERYPRMEIEILPPIGEDSRMILLVQQIIRDRAA
jgi:sirohydrochlorin cobaltochelatase